MVPILGFLLLVGRLLLLLPHQPHLQRGESALRRYLTLTRCLIELESSSKESSSKPRVWELDIALQLYGRWLLAGLLPARINLPLRPKGILYPLRIFLQDSEGPGLEPYLPMSN